MTDHSYQPSPAGLRAFVAVARKRHFRSAAEELGVSQPSLSQALAALEAGLGTQLVERSTRRVFLTPDGEALLGPAAAAVDALDEFVVAARGADDPFAGAIRLGIIPTVAPYILPRVLRGLRSRMPALAVRVIEDQTARLIDALREGAVDAAVLALPSEARGLQEVSLYHEDFVLAVPTGHPLAGRRRVETQALDDLPLLLLDEGHCLRDQALAVCQLAGFRPDLGHTRAASLATAVQCVEGGLGVTLLPATAVAAETAGGGVATATFVRPRPGREIGMVFRESTRRDDTYRALAEVIRDEVEATGVVGR